MKSWLEELLHFTEEEKNENQIFSEIQTKALALGFEFCAYGYSAALPVSNPKVVMLNNYPLLWRQRYAQAGFLHTDPTVLHGRKSQTPLLWSDALFAQTRPFWEEAKSFGLKYGWAQSSLDGLGSGGMLTLSRSADVLTAKELDAVQHKMRWLVQVAHICLARAIRSTMREESGIYLTAREVEVLKWTADGKSAQDVADILTVSKNTVDFHIKNAMGKLQSCNKTATVVQAAMLGYLN